MKFKFSGEILMKKRLISIILLLLIVKITLLTSCVNKSKDLLNNEQTSISIVKPKDTIQLWYYIFSKGVYEHEIASIVDKAKQYCEESNINLEVVGYDRDAMSEEDYILKRNIAMASGNAIVVDNLRNLRMIAEQHADYSKIDNYDTLLNPYKNKFCIPLGAMYDGISLDSKVLQYYGISTNRILTYSEYLELKQDLKEKGARFELNNREFGQVIEYYMYKNSFIYLYEDDEKLKEKNKFKEVLKTIITGVCNDIIIYNDADLRISNNNMDIHDKTSNISFDIFGFNDVRDILSPGSYSSVVNSSLHGKYQTDMTDKILYIDPHSSGSTPNIFLYKKITDERIYGLVNHLANEETFIMIQTSDINGRKELQQSYAPVFKIDKAKELLNLNDNFEYVRLDYNFGYENIKLVNLSYDMVLKDEEKLKELTNAHFSNIDYRSEIRYFIMKTVEKIAQKLSGEDSSLIKFNSEYEQINDFIDEIIDEYVTNWYIYNN
jgi:hypothetical protein